MGLWSRANLSLRPRMVVVTWSVCCIALRDQVLFRPICLLSLTLFSVSLVSLSLSFSVYRFSLSLSLFSYSLLFSVSLFFSLSLFLSLFVWLCECDTEKYFQAVTCPTIAERMGSKLNLMEILKHKVSHVKCEILTAKFSNSTEKVSNKILTAKFSNNAVTEKVSDKIQQVLS